MIASIIKLIQDKILRKRKSSGIFIHYRTHFDDYEPVTIELHTEADGYEYTYGISMVVSYKVFPDHIPIFLLGEE